MNTTTADQRDDFDRAENDALRLYSSLRSDVLSVSITSDQDETTKRYGLVVFVASEAAKVRVARHLITLTSSSQQYVDKCSQRHVVFALPLRT